MHHIENYISPEEPRTLDDYFGYGIKDTLEEIEYNMEGLSLTIIMEPYDEERSDLKQIFEYKLLEDEEKELQKKEHQQEAENTVKVKIEPKEGEIDNLQLKEEIETIPEENQPQTDEDLLKLIKRIELRHKDYDNLFNKVMEKLKELQEQYSEKHYKFSIIKRNNHSHSDSLSDDSSDSESDLSCCDEDSDTSSESSSGKRKSSSDESDTEIDPEHRSKSPCSIEYPYSAGPLSEMLILGPNGTEISRKDFDSLRWKDSAGATRDLCNVIFGEDILATHSLTGNQSPAFRGRERPIKAQLDSNKTADITHFICYRFKVTPQLVRATITTKCADAAKKIKRMKLKKDETV
ncbi:early boundary activity protein 2-like [Episyrphus balteatus]|uniref:early boundary activity protein 2-like n=1 Tax=Episyrphus balteatus TaxID=286459 RepID=UPI0024854B85|nr:early boundary activity protein 2-like [Episyrphus balteatus]